MRGTGLNPAQDFSQNTLQIPYHIQIAEASNLQPVVPQVGRAQTVFRQTSFVEVLTAIEFDHKSQLCTVEVQNIRRTRMLLTKFESC